MRGSEEVLRTALQELASAPKLKPGQRAEWPDKPAEGCSAAQEDPLEQA